MSQRAPLYIFALAALAIQGCGKDVEKSGHLAAQVEPGPTTTSTTPIPVTPLPSPSGGPLPATVTDGSCADPIGPLNYRVASFSDLTAFETGSWSLDHVVTYTVASVRPGQPDARMGTSALEVHPYSSRAFRPLCKDMRQMPAGYMTWSTDVPLSIDAANGDVEQDLVVNETVTGPQSRVAGRRQMATTDAECENLEGSMGQLSSQGCKPVMVYQIDAEHILLVKSSEETDGNGSKVTVRTAATYELLGAAVPSARPSPSPANPAQTNPAQTNPIQVGRTAN